VANVDSRAESIEKKIARLDAELRKYKVGCKFFFYTRACTYLMLFGTNVTVNFYNMVPLPVIVGRVVPIQISFSFVLYPDSDLDSIVEY
jgi:hypothetical protein